ncbi:hypothetical protein F4777DRAFT_553032 [Nemania sp. FL0916]|nr:hypothetical protein F4777DRAFT_553032 [Nemania sp. FL0916]
MLIGQKSLLSIIAVLSTAVCAMTIPTTTIPTVSNTLVGALAHLPTHLPTDYPEPPAASMDITEADVDAKHHECDQEKCHNCIVNTCGSLGNFGCFYFQCMKSACKDCQHWQF